MTSTVYPSTDTLNSTVEFDSPFQVDEDGGVTPYLSGVYGPEMIMGDDPDAPAGWDWWSTGYTGQHGYRGPHMHNSEYLGGRMARDLLSEPGIYVVCAVDWPCADDCFSPDRWADGDAPEPDEYGECGGDHVEGWVILRQTD